LSQIIASMFGTTSDLRDNRLSINVTSPTGIRAIKSLGGPHRGDDLGQDRGAEEVIVHVLFLTWEGDYIVDKPSGMN
jgi:hypothetical protein